MVAPEQIPVPGNGSVEICMLAIAKQLAKQHRVTIVSRQSPGLPKNTRSGQLHIVRVPSGSPRTYIRSVLNYIQGKMYDFIQVDNRPHYMSAIKQAFPHTPVSLFLHSLTFVPAARRVAASMAHADLIIANSDSLKSSLAQRFPRQAAKLRRVHLGVDVNRFKPGKKRSAASSFHVLFAGRIIPRKGIGTLLKSMRLVRKTNPGVRLTIVGGGKPLYTQRLKAMARHLGVPARFTGKVSHRAIHRLYRTADCFVCPSQRHEAFGLVNVEAMASAVPVVASNIGGIKEIVKHGSNGYLVNRFKAPAAHAKWISKLARDRALASRLAKQARADALRRFSWKQTASKLAGIYNEYKR